MDGKPPRARVVLKIQSGDMHHLRQEILLMAVSRISQILPGLMRRSPLYPPSPTRSDGAKKRGGKRGHRIGASAADSLERRMAVKVAAA